MYKIHSKKFHWSLVRLPFPALTISIIAGAVVAGLSQAALAADSISDGPVVTHHRPLGVTDQLPRATHQIPAAAVEQGSPGYNLLQLRGIELLGTDTQQIDELADRLRQIVRARYESDRLYAESLLTIDELRQQLTEYQSLLQENEDRQRLLDSNKNQLHDQLSHMLGERDNALHRLEKLRGQMQDQMGSVQALRLETASVGEQLAARDNEINDLNSRLQQVGIERDEAAATARHYQELVDARDQQITDLNDQMRQSSHERERMAADLEQQLATLAERDGQISDLNQQIQKIVYDRDNAVANIEELSQQLSAGDQQIADQNRQIDELLSERDRVQQATGQLETQLATLIDDKSRVEQSQVSTVSALNDLQQRLGNSEATVGELTDRLAVVTGEHSLANDQVLSLQQVLVERDNDLNELERKVAELSGEREQARARIDMLQSTIAEKDATGAEVEAERVRLFNELNALQSQLATGNDSLSAEIQSHEQTRSQLHTVQGKTAELQSSLQQHIDERERLLTEADLQIQSRQNLEAQLQAVSGEHDTIQAQLQEATNANSSLQAEVSNLRTDRDELVAIVDDLGTQITTLENEARNASQNFTRELSASTEISQRQTATLEAEVAERDGQISNLNQQLANLDRSLQEAQAENINIEAERARVTGELESANANLNAELNAVSAQLEALHASNTSEILGFKNRILELGDVNVSQLQTLESLQNLNAQLADKLADAKSNLEQLNVDHEFSIQELNSRLEQQQSQVASLQLDLEGANNNVQRLVEESTALDKQLQVLRGEHAESTSELGAAREQIVSYESQLSGSQNRVGELEASLDIANREIETMKNAQRDAEAERDQIAANAEQLRSTLSAELEKAKLENISVQNARADNSIPIRLGNADFFETGSAQLTDQGAEKLARLAEIIHSYHDRRIVVEGHTDSVPIGIGLRSKFASNWELSVARAAAAVRHMQSATSIPPQTMMAAGYGEFRPVASNDIESGRQQNRRIEVVLYPVAADYQRLSVLED